MYISPPQSISGTSQIYVDDPAIPRSDSYVQVQNASGFSLLVQVGSNQQSVPPNTAVTIDLTGGYRLVITPYATASPGDGTLTFVWLLANERSSTPDGPIPGTTATPYQLTFYEIDNASSSTPAYGTGYSNATAGPSYIQADFGPMNSFSSQVKIAVRISYYGTGSYSVKVEGNLTLDSYFFESGLTGTFAQTISFTVPSNQDTNFYLIIDFTSGTPVGDLVLVVYSADAQ